METEGQVNKIMRLEIWKGRRWIKNTTLYIFQAVGH